jgi:hypothetical protein
MFLTNLLVDFFQEDWSARCFELRSQDQPFRAQTGDYRPLPVGATHLNIGAHVILGDEWGIRLDSPCYPVDIWRVRSDERVDFEISYSGVTPPMAGIGAYNLVLPRSWRFDNLEVDNPNHLSESGHEYTVARDNEDDREAVILYFQGANTRFNLAIQAVPGSRKADCPDLGVRLYPSHIVEPSAVQSKAELTAIREVLSHWETGTRLRNLTSESDPDVSGLSESVKRWRRVCQDAIKVLPEGAQRDMVLEGQEAAIPVDSLLDKIRSRNDPSSWNELDKAIEYMQRRIEIQMQALAKSVNRVLKPRKPEQ